MHLLTADEGPAGTTSTLGPRATRPAGTRAREAPDIRLVAKTPFMSVSMPSAQRPSGWVRAVVLILSVLAMIPLVVVYVVASCAAAAAVGTATAAVWVWRTISPVRAPAHQA
ncbi:hypothetical protein [Cellulosimicrobium arenosum]|uniref:Uncharacterized protein n=1 Tax=Cellulosimicrobium arenosum TaxID=2708133 RepID=A0A927IYQ8_9MICO|nr:hypothetical protein [Cellulosimicrobium arenosum]MBD8077830.1 hypothetical protein [Cellulosimicrobium arenosum]